MTCPPPGSSWWSDPGASNDGKVKGYRCSVREHGHGRIDGEARGGSAPKPPPARYSTYWRTTATLSHTGGASWMLGDGMATTTAVHGGRTVGSRIAMAGRSFGFLLYLDEADTVQEPPL